MVLIPLQFGLRGSVMALEGWGGGRGEEREREYSWITE